MGTPGQPRGQYYHGLLSEPDCNSCPLMKDTKVHPDGPCPAPIAFVGEEPGNVELQEGRGFVGPSGQLLWMLAERAGFDRDNVWVTNAMLCKARQIKLPSGAVIPKATVKAQAAAACRGRLLAEMALVDPVVIVPLGNWALWALSDIPKSRIFAYRGSRLDVDLRALLEKVKAGTARVQKREVK